MQDPTRYVCLLSCPSLVMPLHLSLNLPASDPWPVHAQTWTVTNREVPMPEHTDIYHLTRYSQAARLPSAARISHAA